MKLPPSVAVAAATGMVILPPIMGGEAPAPQHGLAHDSRIMKASPKQPLVFGLGVGWGGTRKIMFGIVFWTYW